MYTPIGTHRYVVYSADRELVIYRNYVRSDRPAGHAAGTITAYTILHNTIRMANIRSLCVYCGSSDLGSPHHRTEAAKLGRILAAKGIELVFGGGRVGLMGIIADAALSSGGRVTGVIPDHLIRAEVGHAEVSELVVVDSMHVRKQIMFERSDAFVVLPGGPGTLDETFEILTWRQLRLHDKPVVICNLGGYWRKLIDLIEMLIGENYARPEFRSFYTVVDTIEDILPTIARAPEPTLPPRVRKI